MRILAVDDSETDLLKVKALLEEMGHDVHTAHTIKDAAVMDQRQVFDLIVLDAILPDATSPNVTMFFIETARAPVVILTGFPGFFKERDHLNVLDKKDFVEELTGIVNDMEQNTTGK